MANVIQLGNLKTYVPYTSEGMRAWTESLSRFMPPSLLNSDALALYVGDTLTTTAVAIKASAGYVHGVYLESRGAIAYLSLWNVAQGGVTVGTTSQQFAIGVSATSGQSHCAPLFGTAIGVAPLWTTAITAAISTTVTGGPAAPATLPLVIIAYS